MQNRNQPTFSPNRSMKASAFQRPQLDIVTSPISPKRLLLTQSTTTSPTTTSPRRNIFCDGEMSPSTYRRAEEKRVESKLCNKEETGEMIGQWRESGQRTPVRPDSPDEFVMIEKVDYQIETKSQKAQRIELEFVKLLDTMDLTSTVRARMLTLTTLSVKEGMLNTSVSKSPLFSEIPPSPNKSTLKKSRSRIGSGMDENIFSGSNTPLRNDSFSFFSPKKSDKEKKTPFQSTSSRSNPADLDLPPSPTKPGHSRSNSSFLRSLGRSTLPPTPTTSVSSVSSGADAAHQAVWLRTTTFQKMGIEKLGDLRRRLRNESTGWVDEFLRCGGYVGLLERLKELIEVEFREEQRDDKLLHEILRCLKSLLLTTSGQKAFINLSPSPFVQLAGLLYSPKKPGDLPTRSLLIELLSTILTLQPTATTFNWTDLIQPTPSRSSGDIFTRKAKTGNESEENKNEAHNFLYELMKGPPDAKLENQVAFITEVRKPRIFKQWVNEILEIKRNYFWIFCHSENSFGNLALLNTEAIEAPQVPSGMTNGVESEAMAYLLEHFRLMNGLATTCATEESAFSFHLDLFKSGFGEAVVDIRKSSQLYYPLLHLELSRYVANARAARFNLQYAILKYVPSTTLSRAETSIVAEGRIKEVEDQRVRTEKAKGRGEGPRLLELNL